MRRRDFVAILGRIGTYAVLAPPLSRETGLPVRLPPPRLDTHTHVFGPATVNRIRSLLETPEIKNAITTVEGHHIVDALNQTGIERALLLSTAYALAGDDEAWPRTSPLEERQDVREENDFTAAEAARTPNRLIPFASVNPKRDDAIDELTRCVDTLGMRGLNVHFSSSDVRLRDPHHLERIRRLFARAAEMNIPVIAEIHNPKNEGFIEAEIDLLVSSVVAPLPRLRILIAHLGSAGGPDRHVDEAFAAVCAALDRHHGLRHRVWFDCSAVFMQMAFPPGSAAAEQRLERLSTQLKKWPADRVLWGSDSSGDALSETREIWPLSEAAWETMARTDGRALLEIAG